jgi:hypothetical protein
LIDVKKFLRFFFNYFFRRGNAANPSSGRAEMDAIAASPPGGQAY